ncbi:cyclin-dependent kinase protein [Colletotrichum incanum]|nr:cyclin-dependent kinase protein [Colletotrichum incanum]
MDPSSPAKRRALAPLDANVNAMSPTKMHKHSTVPGSPRKSPVKTPLGLKRPLAAVVFDENAVAKKKQCQEPAAAPISVSASAATNASALAPVHVSAGTPTPAAPTTASEDTTASRSTSTSTPTPAAPAQTEMDAEPDTKDDQNEQQDEDKEQEPDDEQPGQRQLDKMQTHNEQQQQTQQTLRNRSASPDTSSVFDNSAMDTSQENTTMLTEPDAEQAARALPPPRPRRLLTREEARQKARILRLKLGLANYKLQTGQENVPLDRLEVKPRPGQNLEITRERALPRVTVQPPSSRDGPPENDMQETRDIEQQEKEPEPVAEAEKATEQTEAEKTVLPRLETVETGAAEEGDEPTSAVFGGVASSLLSLARGSSSVSSS